jgi:hypothetical protein
MRKHFYVIYERTRYHTLSLLCFHNMPTDDVRTQEIGLISRNAGVGSGK